MRNLPMTSSIVRRSYGARCDALVEIRKIVRGSTKLKDVNLSTTHELLACLDQTIDMLNLFTTSAELTRKLRTVIDEERIRAHMPPDGPTTHCPTCGKLLSPAEPTVEEI